MAHEEACCDSGFTATAGWDQLTGFGSITFPSLLELTAKSTESSSFGSRNESKGSDDDDSGPMAPGVIAAVAIGVAIIVFGFAYIFSGRLGEMSPQEYFSSKKHPHKPGECRLSVPPPGTVHPPTENHTTATVNSLHTERESGNDDDDDAGQTEV